MLRSGVLSHPPACCMCVSLIPFLLFSLFLSCGYPCAQAPEVVRCPHKVFPEENKHRADVQYGGAVDIWAVGVLVVELVGGESPFKGASRGGGTAHGPREREGQHCGGGHSWAHMAASGQLRSAIML